MMEGGVNHGEIDKRASNGDLLPDLVLFLVSGGTGWTQ